MRLYISIILAFYFFSWGTENDFKKYSVDIKEIAEKFSSGLLNKEALINILGENLKIFHFDPERIEQNKKEDMGNLYIEKGCLIISLLYSGKNKRESGQSAETVCIKDRKGIPIPLLVDIFGKCDHDTKRLSKIRKMRFSKNINNKNIKVYAWDVLGPSDPMKCKVISISIRIEN
jgi:hypothetical protein